MRTKPVSALIVVALGIVLYGPARALSATDQPIAPRLSCASLATPDAQLGTPGFPTLPGPPFLISAASDLTTDAGAVYCQVTGIISPQTHFELQMPEQNWHGDYVQEGCGGFCGATNLSLEPASSIGCAPVANGEIAVAIDDQGHTGVNGGDGTWATEVPMLRVVFGYRSEHDLALDSACLTPAQVEVARKAYRGPTDPDGRNLFDGGVAYGSELAWTPWFVGPADDLSAPFNTIAGRFGTFYLKYMAYWDNPPPSYTIQSFEFTDQAYQDLLGLQGIYAANNTNLQPFRDAGGKLIIVHGWSDQTISPWSTINYYAGVADFLGGFDATQSFSRLYMVPGGYHCFGGGDPFTRGDFLTPLINWVEHGQAPDALTVPVAPAPTNTTSLTSVTVEPFNPLVKPAANDGLNSNYDYVGATTTYTPDNQAWCEEQGTQLVCATRRSP